MSVLSHRSNNMDYHCLQRAKVYRLNDDGKWDDKGTGHVSVEFLEQSDAVGLIVVDEEDNTTLLVHHISADDIYRRQEDTIISWSDPEVATDLALSFQEAMGCSYIWDHICNVQRNIHFPSVGALDVGPRATNEDFQHSGAAQGIDDTYPEGISSDALELPAVELSSLPQIVKIVTEISPSFLDRERMASLIIRDPSFLHKLMELFRICEELENMEGLHMLHRIIKGIFLLNDRRIFDTIFSDDYIMDVVGSLEYDPELPFRQEHRNFLCNFVNFKEVVPIQDPGILSKIHQTYRLGYIKDVVLPRLLDDRTFVTMNAMILANNVVVISALQDDCTFIKELFAGLHSPTISEHARKDLVHFIQELCSSSKSLQLANRIQLFSSLVKEGLFDIVTETLQSSDQSLRLYGTDILIVVLNHDPGIVRKYLVHQQDNALCGLLVAGMLTSGEGGLQAQLLEVICMLLDCDSTDQGEKSSFLDIFYQKYMDQMTEMLCSACPAVGSPEQSRKSDASLEHMQKTGIIAPEILGNICEILCFCVQHHSYRIKYYILRKNVIEKVMQLTQRREKYLVVAAVRFLRTCVSRKDEFYNRYIVKHDLFQPVVRAFLANGSRYNLLNSAVLELFDFIRMESIRSLTSYIIEKYSDKLAKVDYINTFQQLKLKHEQLLEGNATGSQDTAAVSGRGKDPVSILVRERLNEGNSIPDPWKRKEEQALDVEDYFNEHKDGPFGLLDHGNEGSDAPVAPESTVKECQLDGSDGLVSPIETKGPSRWPNMIEDTEINVKRNFYSQEETKKDETDTQNVKQNPCSQEETKNNEAEIMKRRKIHTNANEQFKRDIVKESAKRPIARIELRSNLFDHGIHIEHEKCADTIPDENLQVYHLHDSDTALEQNGRNANSPRSIGHRKKSNDGILSGMYNAKTITEQQDLGTNGSNICKASGDGIARSMPPERTRCGGPSPGTQSVQ
eukprot:c29096_g3_i1 orf=446-3331(+)